MTTMWWKFFHRTTASHAYYCSVECLRVVVVLMSNSRDTVYFVIFVVIIHVCDAVVSSSLLNNIEIIEK